MIIKYIKIAYNRFFNKTNWYNLRSLTPKSKVFGLDRGQPVDRYYIENFLKDNKNLIKGKLLEVSEDTYSQMFGSEITGIDILHLNNENKKATIIGNLSVPESLPENIADCFICTQTLNFIFDLSNSAKTIRQLLKPGGAALVTVAGLCQISRYDMERWGDFWRFTTASIEKLFAPVFGPENITIDYFGNVLTAISLLEGISSSELTKLELDHKDPDYQVVITIKATK